MTLLAQLTSNQFQKEVLINENFKNTSPAGLFSNKALLTTGLNFYFYGGRFLDKNGSILTIADGSITCTVSTTNYIEFDIHNGLVVKNTTGFTNYNIPIAIIVADTIKITSFIDARIIQLAQNGLNNKALQKIIEYTSVITINSLINQTHLTTDIKFNIITRLKCLTAEYGYVINDEVDFNQFDTSGVILAKGFINNTNYGTVVGNSFKIANKTTFVNSTITPANWQIVLRLVPIY